MTEGALGTRAARSPRGREGTALLGTGEGFTRTQRNELTLLSFIPICPKGGREIQITSLAYPDILETRLGSLSFVVIKA